MNGYGLEFYIETPADELPARVEDALRSWQFQLLFTVSQLAAGKAAYADAEKTGCLLASVSM